MKKILLTAKKTILSSILLLTAVSGASGRITIHLMGDSTMSPKNLEGGNVERGWGMMLPWMLDDSVRVINHARGGRSTLSTIDLGHWDEIKSDLRPGEYLFIQFGHNDQKAKDPQRYAPPFGLYQDNLRLFCSTALSRGAHPVILTPVSRRWFVDGMLDEQSLGDYPEAAREVAAELGVPLIDANALTIEWLKSIGDEPSKSYFCWFPAGKYACHPEERRDNTHFNVKGAWKVAELICSTFPSLLPELAEHLKAGCGGSRDSHCERLSQLMVRSEMTRCPDACYLDFKNGEMSWNYTPGLEQKAFLDVWKAYGNDDILAYVDSWYQRAIGQDGTPYNYRVSAYNVDKICPGNTLFTLYEMTGRVRYRMAMDTLMLQYRTHPRTSEGALWHKKVYPHQIWLDGLYMAQPFAAAYATDYLDGDDRKALYADIINDFVITRKHTYVPVTGLYCHAWDESRSMPWCNPVTGQSQHCWCRALGWTCMAIVDVLDWIPEGTEGRGELVSWLRDIVSRLPEYADPVSGMWYQVMDQPGREGNYVESTGSAMFVYAMLKGIRKGYLEASLLDYAVSSYDALVKTFITYGDDGLISINSCCSVGGLGGKQNRMGDFAYYLSEPVRSNDPKGVGPFIWASLEYEGIKNSGCHNNQCRSSRDK